MKKFNLFLLGMILFISVQAQLPFKFDNEYKRIYAEDLCKMARENSALVLIDVRTPGEYSDTSQFNSLNMGHLKGAINIEIEAMKKDSMLMEKYRDKTIVFYCSHSQRSRRVSKLLTERGFTNFYNLNGGMSSINQLSATAFPCKNNWIESNLPYRNIDFIEATSLLKNEKGLFIIDVRPASEFNSTDSSISNNIGRIKGAVSIPYSEFRQRMSELPKDKSRPILLYSSSGDGDGARAALLLTGDGYAKVYQLLGGLDDYEASQGNAMIENALPFRLVDSKTTLALLKANSGLTIYDTRPMLEFENKVTGMESYKNLGNVKNSIHLNEAEFGTVALPSNRDGVILIFGRGEAFRFAKTLIAKGYKNVYLHVGLYDFVWSAFNVGDCKDVLNYLENHSGLY